jgi:L-rhamnose mutarotase
MARVAFMMKLKPGCEAIYKEKHDQIWPELLDLIRRSGVRNYSIFRRDLDLFAYLELDDGAMLPGANGEIEQVQRDWWLMMEPYMEYNDDHTPTIWPMEEVFHVD